MLTNCPNCGAVVEPAESRCPYCGTPYPRDRKAGTAVIVTGGPVFPPDEQQALVEALHRQLVAGIMTPNEARALMGLPPK